MTLTELRGRLLEAEGEEWCRLAGIVLQEVRPDDALVLIGLNQLERHWERLRDLLDSQTEFWEWALGAREIDWERELPKRRRWSPLLSQFWIIQGFSTRVANALSGAGIRSWEILGAMSVKELINVPNLGKAGIAEINGRLSTQTASTSRVTRGDAHPVTVCLVRPFPL